MVAGFASALVTAVATLIWLGPPALFGLMGCQRSPCPEYVLGALATMTGATALIVGLALGTFVLLARSRWLLVGVAASLAALYALAVYLIFGLALATALVGAGAGDVTQWVWGKLAGPGSGSYLLGRG